MKPLFMCKTLIYIISRKHINGNNAVKNDRRTKNKNVPDLLFAKSPKKSKNTSKYEKVSNQTHTGQSSNLAELK